MTPPGGSGPIVSATPATVVATAPLKMSPQQPPADEDDPFASAPFSLPNRSAVASGGNGGGGGSSSSVTAAARKTGGNSS